LHKIISVCKYQNPKTLPICRFTRVPKTDSGDTASLTRVTNVLLLSALITSLYLTAFLICWRDCVPWRNHWYDL